MRTTQFLPLYQLLSNISSNFYSVVRRLKIIKNKSLGVSLKIGDLKSTYRCVDRLID